MPSLLWPRTCLGWFQCPFETLWNLGIFLLLLQMRIYSDWALCYKSRRYRKSPWGHLDGRLPVDFSPACCLRRLGCSSQFDVQTFCLLASDMSRLRSWDWKASLCSRRGFSWWWMKSSLDQPHPIWSSCNQKMHQWSSTTSVLLLSL